MAEEKDEGQVSAVDPVQQVICWQRLLNMDAMHDGLFTVNGAHRWAAQEERSKKVFRFRAGGATGKQTEITAIEALPACMGQIMYFQNTRKERSRTIASSSLSQLIWSPRMVVPRQPQRLRCSSDVRDKTRQSKTCQDRNKLVDFGNKKTGMYQESCRISARPKGWAIRLKVHAAVQQDNSWLWAQVETERRQEMKTMLSENH